MITKRQYTILMFCLVRALFFGTGISFIIQTSKNASWLSALIGIGAGFAISLLIFQINKTKKAKNIVEFLGDGVWGLVGKILLLGIGLVLLNDILASISTIVYAFYLVSTPVIYITISIALVIVYALKKGMSAFARAIEIIFPLSLGLFIFKTLSYSSMVEIDNFKPWIDSDILSILKGSLIYFVNTVVPMILLLNFVNTDYDKKHSTIGYFLGVSTVLITIIMVIGVLGFPLAQVFRYPEYIIMKKVNILDFIANIENILTVTLIFDNIVLGVLSSKLIRDIVGSFIKNEKIMKWWAPFFAPVMVIISLKFFNNNYPNILKLYKYEYLVVFGLFIPALLIILFKTKKKRLN